jgi:ClpP class serine protease
LGAQASEFYVTPSGQVGSIGVFSAHEDISALQEKEGRKISLISAGKYKVEGNPFEPLGEEAKAETQRVVNSYYDMFLGAVAKGRGVPLDNVRKGFGQGRMVLPKEAVAEGMVNDVATFDEALSRALRLAAKPELTGTSSATLGMTSAGELAVTWADGTSQAITSGLGNGPYTEHGERVFRAVQEFAERTRERKAERLAESGRGLSAGDRQRLQELAGEMRGAADVLVELASQPSAEASRAEAEFLAILNSSGETL